MTTPTVVRYGDHPDQFVHRYDAQEPLGTVISIHGGYWRAKYGLDLHDPIAVHLQARGWTTLNIEYRRVGEDGGTGWDEMSSDVTAASLLADGLAGPTVALGHSAGGQLALWAAAQSEIRLDGVVALAPVSDLFLADGLELSDHATRALFGASAAERPDLYAGASPLYLLPLGVSQLVVHGRADVDVPYEMAPEYVQAATQAGDDVALVDPKNVDHFDVIDPRHLVWREIDTVLARWAQR